MDALISRSRRRKSDVVPLFNVAPAPPGEDHAMAAPGRRKSRLKPPTWSPENVIPAAPEPEAITGAAQAPVPAFSSVVKSPQRFNSFARSVISMNKHQGRKTPHGSDEEDNTSRDHRSNNQEESAATLPLPMRDPWGNVLGKVMRKTSFRGGVSGESGGNSVTTSAASKRVSLTQMLKSREVTDLVKQAIVTTKWSENVSKSRDTSSKPSQRSSVMEHWLKTSKLRNPDPLTVAGGAEGLEGDEHEINGIRSGFDLQESLTGSMYGRTLLLEESCRRAFAQSGENRSQTDLQALKAWFQMTKLKITTDFERVQPAELDLLCRRMVLVHLRANEVVFRQGDEGDAMYILFAGCVEVKVAQRILGEKVEVTVCELTKGDYFGERALLHDDPRAATIVAKTPCELVRITRKDYNTMLKKDQQEFYSRMQLAGTVSSSASSAFARAKPSLVLPRSRSTLHQQTQLEYINVLSKKKHARSKADIDMLSEYLHTLKFFRGLPKSFVRELCTVVDFLTLPASSFVFEEGEVGDLFYIIFSGSVDVIVSSKDIRGNTQQTKLINLTEGAHFGELALMKGHGIRSATVLTREETKFLVICEKDYNSTLRRMQKEDLAKRVGVLDRIPMFQTPEWTGELLKEMSYVLSEQKLSTGSVLFRQGEKALQVYFVVRGELLVTKEIVDPVSKQKYVVFVERMGRDRMVGDDAAAGVNFNEVIYREVTVTASTPVELLVLSKYDVFHRLSRAARETLRAAAHSHVESVIYLDRYHKTVKWDAFKQKLLGEHVNLERIGKLLPQVDQFNVAVSRKQRIQPSSSTLVRPILTANAPQKESPARPRARLPERIPASDGLAQLPALRSEVGTKPHVNQDVREVQSTTTTQSQLVDANEFLLLDRVDVATAKCFLSNERTLAHHVSTFNADAMPRAMSRERQLTSALTTERGHQLEILNEGNPLAYFDLDEVQALQRRQQAEMRGRVTNSRRLLLQKRDSSPNMGSTAPSPPSPSEKADAFSAAELATSRMMNQFFQDNFIFSNPEKPAKGKNAERQRVRLLNHLEQRCGTKSCGDKVANNAEPSKRRNASDSAGIVVDKHKSQAEAARKAAEQLCQGDIVLVDLCPVDRIGSTKSSRGSPAFRIVRCCESIEAAKLLVLSSRPKRRDGQPLKESEDKEIDGEDSELAMFAVAKSRFALLPRSTRPRGAEEAQQRAVASRFWQSTPLLLSASQPEAHSFGPTAVFSSFQKLSMTPSEQRELLAAQGKRDGAHVVSLAGTAPVVAADAEYLGIKKATSESLKMFASVSIILSKCELETAFCEEPFLCIHAVYPTEAEAMECALTMPPPALKNALLCILPVGEWVRFDEAYDWCVQIETDRRDKQPPPPASAPSSSPMQHRTGSIYELPDVSAQASVGRSPASSRADWEVEKEKARRLHQFICTRMGLHKSHDKERRSGSGGGDVASATGFTPRPSVTLEDKLATLQDYLATTSQSPLGAKNANSHASIVSKYRQMKRFGSLMRSRISTVGIAGGGGGSLAGVESNGAGTE